MPRVFRPDLWGRRHGLLGGITMPLPQELEHDRITGSEEMQADDREERRQREIMARIDALEKGFQHLKQDVKDLQYNSV
jgi:hypothetical protein